MGSNPIDATMTEIIKEENFFYCRLCDTVSYKFDCCGNTTCNGGGCPKCKDRKELNLTIERCEEIRRYSKEWQ